jgi:hypothetical protein
MLAQTLRHWLFDRRLRFNRRELSGAFGDLGTDLPLIVGMVLAGGFNASWAFFCFGLFQIASAVVYGIPMPVQPLKAVAILVITQQIAPPVINGGAMAIAAIMLVLTISGSIDGLAKLIPGPVIRGIQFGLGVKLATLALGKYVPSDGLSGYVLAGVCVMVIVGLLHHRRFPATVVVLLIGILSAFLRGTPIHASNPISTGIPSFSLPNWPDIWMGFLLLALPQIPLSLGNSLLATKQLADDWFPERQIPLRRIGITYSLFNALAAVFGGIPVCHGSGGMAGHYVFGARTGGSLVIYGLFNIVLGVACAIGFTNITGLFPLPVLGVILFVESLTLMTRLKEVMGSRTDLVIALGVGLIAAWIPNGFLIGMVIGGILSAVCRFLKYRSHSYSESIEV